MLKLMDNTKITILCLKICLCLPLIDYSLPNQERQLVASDKSIHTLGYGEQQHAQENCINAKTLQLVSVYVLSKREWPQSIWKFLLKLKPKR